MQHNRSHADIEKTLKAIYALFGCDSIESLDDMFRAADQELLHQYAWDYTVADALPNRIFQALKDVPYQDIPNKDEQYWVQQILDPREQLPSPSTNTPGILTLPPD
jgi:hypothetical protein